MRSRIRAAAAFAFALGLSACGGGDGGAGSTTSTASGAGASPAAASTADLAQRGRAAYQANCIACHAADPTQDGALGPAVAGASRELLEARVLAARYAASPWG